MAPFFLTTVPAVKPPGFVVESDVPDPRGGLWIKLSSGPVMEGAQQRIYLFYDSNFGPDAHPDMVEVGDDGHVPLDPNRWPKFIIPEIPVYPIINKPIPITGTGGHLITLRFDKNDIGKADFRAFKLPIENGELIMTRPDLELQLHFRRQAHTKAILLLLLSCCHSQRESAVAFLHPLCNLCDLRVKTFAFAFLYCLLATVYFLVKPLRPVQISNAPMNTGYFSLKKFARLPLPVCYP